MPEGYPRGGRHDAQPLCMYPATRHHHHQCLVSTGVMSRYFFFRLQRTEIDPAMLIFSRPPRSCNPTQYSAGAPLSTAVSVTLSGTSESTSSMFQTLLVFWVPEKSGVKDSTVTNRTATISWQYVIVRHRIPVPAQNLFCRRILRAHLTENSYLNSAALIDACGCRRHSWQE